MKQIIEVIFDLKKYHPSQMKSKSYLMDTENFELAHKKAIEELERDEPELHKYYIKESVKMPNRRLIQCSNSANVA